MYNHAPKDYICPLCQIAKGEETDHGSQEDSVVYRDDISTIFIGGKWWKRNLGHVLVIPNAHIENLYDMPEEVGHRIFDLSKKAALALKEEYKCEGVSTRQHNEPAGNQDAYHFHLHVFPRYDGDDLYLNHKDTYWPTMEEKKPYADRLKKYF